MKLLICIVSLFLFAIGSYRLIQGVQYWQRNKEIKQGYIQAVEKLKQKQQQLKDEIYRLNYNLLTQERLARELGYIRPGEIVYKILPKSQNTD